MDNKWIRPKINGMWSNMVYCSQCGESSISEDKKCSSCNSIMNGVIKLENTTSYIMVSGTNYFDVDGDEFIECKCKNCQHIIDMELSRNKVRHKGFFVCPNCGYYVIKFDNDLQR